MTFKPACGPQPIRWWRLSALFVAVILAAMFLEAFIAAAISGN